MALLSDNGTGFKYKVLNKVCDQLGIKMLFSNLFHPQGNAKVENVHNFLKKALTKFLDNSNLEWDEPLHSLVIVLTYFQEAMAPYPHSSLCLDEIQQKDAYLTLTIEIGIMEPMKEK